MTKLKNRLLQVSAGLMLGLCASVVQAVGVEVTYYHNDLLGSPVAATDETGELKWRKSYKPYGEELETAPDSEEEFVGYTGHRLDKETGLVYAGARHYDPVIGRFMGVDPEGVREHIESNPMMFNRFAYGNNNPFRFVDPDGEEVVPVGTDKQKFLINAALNRLRQSNPETRSQLEELERSSNRHEIRFPKGKEAPQNKTTGVKENESNGVGTGSETVVDVTRDTEFKTGRSRAFRSSGEAVLVHELLGHGLDKDRGELDRSFDYSSRPVTKKSEVNAMDRANTYRKSVGESIRKEY